MSQGWYVPASAPETPEQRILEQSVRLPPGGAVTGWALLRLHGANFFDEMRHTRDVQEAVVAMDMAAAAVLVSIGRERVYHAARHVWDLEGNLLGIADFLDVDAGLVAEYDGADHRGALRHTRDIAREEGFRRHQLEVFRVTGLDLAVFCDPQAARPVEHAVGRTPRRGAPSAGLSRTGRSGNGRRGG